jgi:purine-nucleoside phosphorylase
MSALDHILPNVIRDLKPRWGIVLGSGLGEVAESAEVIEKIPYHDVPGLPQSRVAGHVGQFLIARIAGAPVVVAQGRVHLYEGHSPADTTAGIRFMAECGVERLILTNAAGALNPRFSPGEWMMISDHLNFTGTSPLIGGPSFIDMSAVYSSRLRDHFHATAGEMRMPLHEGVYAGMLGPQYETPAEIRMLGKLGADAVGMSTVLEAIQARALGLEVAGFSCLSNWAAGISSEPITHADVLQTGASAADVFGRLLERALQTWND